MSSIQNPSEPPSSNTGHVTKVSQFCNMFVKPARFCDTPVIFAHFVPRTFWVKKAEHFCHLMHHAPRTLHFALLPISAQSLPSVSVAGLSTIGLASCFG
jgi:hypothetical protein